MKTAQPRTPGKVEGRCVACGKIFARYASQIRQAAQPHCSNACVGLTKRNGDVLKCARCGESFYRRKGEQGNSGKQYCSRDCHLSDREANRKPDTYKKIGPVHEHRLVAERFLGRALNPGEIVHHIDADKHNNTPENLAVFPDQATHVRCHAGSMSNEELRRFSLV